MEYINLHVSAIDSSEFKGATPDQQGTWLCAMRYACGQEAGDTIAACLQWTERQWQTIVGAEKNILLQPCGLWEWKGDDLVLNFYPIDQEKLVSKLRKAGIKGNRIKWAKKNKPDSPPDSQKTHIGDSPPDSGSVSVMKCNEMKCNEMEAARVVTIAQAIKWMQEQKSGYSDEQISEQFWYYDALRDPETGQWRKPTRTGAFVLISDWRSELCAALARFGAQKNGELKKSGAWELKQRLELLREQEREHPGNAENASDEERDDLDRIRSSIRRTEAEIATP